MQPLGDVIGRVEAAEDLLTLDQRLRSLPHVVVVGGLGGRHRGIHEAELVRVELMVRADMGQVSRLAEIDLVLTAARPGTDAETDQAVPTLLEHQEVAEQLEPLEEDVPSMWDDLLPMVLAG